MILLNEKGNNRREWFRALGRVAALCGLAWIGKTAVYRTGRPLPETRCEDTLSYQESCQECRIFDSCTHPRVLSSKQAVKDTNGE